MNGSRVFIFIVIFFALAPIVAKLIGGIVNHLQQFSRLAGLIPTMIVSLVLFFAWLSHAVGAPELLGGFAAGLALSRRFFLPFSTTFAHPDGRFVFQIERKMKPIIQLFTPIFFVMVGLSLNLPDIDWGSSMVWKMTLLFILIAIGSKMVGAYLLRESTHSKWAIGLAMIPRAEVGLVFAELGRSSGVFDNELYAVMILTIVATTILPPFMMKYFYERYGHHLPNQ
jgi:Kef-type K+ transport system membrane component KefB